MTWCLNYFSEVLNWEEPFFSLQTSKSNQGEYDFKGQAQSTGPTALGSAGSRLTGWGNPAELVDPFSSCHQAFAR